MDDELLPDPIEVMERAAERIYESDWYEQAIAAARKQGAIEALDRAIAMLSHYNMPSVAAMQELRAVIEREK